MSKAICYVTGCVIDPSECDECYTRSCPVNTGFAEGPEYCPDDFPEESNHEHPSN